jgi:hypothetical protein
MNLCGKAEDLEKPTEYRRKTVSLTLPYHIAMGIKTMQYLQKNRYVDQWSRTDTSEINPQNCQLNF